MKILEQIENLREVLALIESVRVNLSQDGLDEYIAGAVKRMPKFGKAYRSLRMVFDQKLTSEARQQTIFGAQGIVFGPKFFRLSIGHRDLVLVHEIGHWVSGKVGLAEWIRRAGDYGIDPWDAGSLPWGEMNMEEAFAESFAVATMGHDKRWTEWQRLARDMGKLAGV